jgi:hypothetical protein
MTTILNNGQPITTEDQLNAALATADAASGGDFQINLGANITLNKALQAINLQSGVRLDIEGNTYAINGSNQFGGLFVYSGVVAINNLTVENTVERGANGGSGGGGGGAGMGGGLFVAGATDADGTTVKATISPAHFPAFTLYPVASDAYQAVVPVVSLFNVNFSNDAAIGGSGGPSGNPAYAAGGGLDAGGGGPPPGVPYTSPAGFYGIFNAFGGGGLLYFGSGGYGGGGASGGSGGYGGGGGGVGAISYYGGGTGAAPTQGGGSQSGSFAGGGGLGAGGDIFVQAGGTVIIAGTGPQTNGSVQGGASGGGNAQSGSAYGAGIFLQSGQTFGVVAPFGQTTTVGASITDPKANGWGNIPSVAAPGFRTNDSGSATVNINVTGGGGGTVMLTGNNTYTGGTTIGGGTLKLTGPHEVGSGDIVFNSPGTATLEFSAANAPSNTIDFNGGNGQIVIDGFVATGNSFNNGVLTLNGTGGPVTLNIGGSLAPIVTTNTVAQTTTINEPKTVLQVNSEADLRNAIIAANAGANTHTVYVINIGSQGSPVDISLSQDLPVLNGNVTIEGNGSTIDGGNKYRGLLVYSGNVAVKDLNFNDTAAIGGAGGNSTGYEAGAGGGGAGLGGGLFVATGANVTISNVNFTGTSAIGGKGGVSAPPHFTAKSPGVFTNGDEGGGGGGGMGGDGGSNSGTNGGGGGGLGIGANGGGGSNGTGGAGSFIGAGPGAYGSSSSKTYGYLVYTNTKHNYGGAGGANAGGGGVGAGGGGGGGGPNAAFPGNQDQGSAGVALDWDAGNFLIDFLALEDPEVITPAIAVALTATYALVTHFTQNLPGLGSAYHQLTSYHVGWGGGQDAQGTGVPGLVGKVIIGPLSKGVLNGLGLSLAIIYNSGSSQVDGGDGAFGGGGGGGGDNSYPGGGGFGGGAGGLGSIAALKGNPNNPQQLSGIAGFGGGAGGTYGKAFTIAPRFGGGQAVQGAVTTGNGAGSSVTVQTAGVAGGGLGAGGAVFVQDGGNLTDLGSTFTNTTAAGGQSSFDGMNASGLGLGQSVFLQGNSQMTVAPPSGQTVTIGNIADEAGTADASGNYSADLTINGAFVARGSVGVSGQGTVLLTGTNTYLGGTFLNSQVLTVNPQTEAYNPGGSTLEIAAGTTLYGGIYVYGTEPQGYNDAPATRHGIQVNVS